VAKFEEHINQAKKNLMTLQSVSQKVPDSWDWQVTMCYYTAVHLMNGHLAKIADLHYSTHEKVKNALYLDLSPGKIPDEIYTAYVKLEGLSRRARYLCHEDSASSENHLTYDRHLKKSIQKLDIILDFFKSKYGIDFPVVELDCIELKGKTYNCFKYLVKAA
jgi:hypothetical protein